MFCPRCEYEFMSGMTICPECQLALVETRPSNIHAAVTPDDSWMEVCGVRSNARAQAAKQALDEANVPSVLLSSRFLNGQGMAQNDLASEYPEVTVIMVPRDFLDEAEMVAVTILGEDFIPIDEL